MAYETLKKIHYKSTPEEYEQAYQRKISSDACVNIDFFMGEYPAFFLITPEINRSMAEIYKKDKQIYKLCKYLPGIALDQYEKTCLIDEIVLTNKIEGVHSTRKEIGEVLENLDTEHSQNRFYGLVHKYTKLLSNSPVKIETCQDIRNLYDELFLDEIIEKDEDKRPDGLYFRKDSVSVYSATGKELHRGLYPEDKIIENMERALAFLKNNDISLLLRMAAFHYLFGYIHPFYDGNGRTSRFISAYLISKELEPMIAYRISYAIKNQIHSYYEAFQECNDIWNRGDLTPFIEMFIHIIEQAMDELETSLKEKLRETRICINKLNKCVLNYGNEKLARIYEVLINVALFSEMGISGKELCDCLNMSEATVRKYLNKVQENGLLKSIKNGHKKNYMLDIQQLSVLQSVQ